MNDISWYRRIFLAPYQSTKTFSLLPPRTGCIRMAPQYSHHFLTYLCRPPDPTPPLFMPTDSSYSSILNRFILINSGKSSNTILFKSFLSISQLVSTSGTELSQQQELKTTYTLTWPTFDLNVLIIFQTINF